MDTIYNGAVEYERMKTFAGMGLCIILGICFISSAISSIYSSITEEKTTEKEKTNNDSSKFSVSILCCIGCICFLVSFGLYYMATNKSMEKMLAVNGAINAASTVSNIFMRNGGYFDVGE